MTAVWILSYIGAFYIGMTVLVSIVTYLVMRDAKKDAQKLASMPPPNPAERVDIW